MKKQNIQNSDYVKREKNFLNMVTAEDTFQVIVGNDGSDALLLWQDEYFMEAYLNECKTPIKLSKVDTIIFLKWMNENNQNVHCCIHPVFGQEIPELQAKEFVAKIINKMESEGGFYDTLRENNLL